MALTRSRKFYLKLFYHMLKAGFYKELCGWRTHWIAILRNHRSRVKVEQDSHRVHFMYRGHIKSPELNPEAVFDLQASMLLYEVSMMMRFLQGYTKKRPATKATGRRS